MNLDCWCLILNRLSLEDLLNCRPVDCQFRNLIRRYLERSGGEVRLYYRASTFDPDEVDARLSQAIAAFPRVNFQLAKGYRVLTNACLPNIYRLGTVYPLNYLGCVNLRRLTLGCRCPFYAEWVEALPHLEHLNVQSCEDTVRCEQLTKLVGLKTLKFRDEEVYLRSLTRLTSLTLGASELRSYSDDILQQLTHLGLASTLDPASFRRLTNLRSLALRPDSPHRADLPLLPLLQHVRFKHV